jgi:hypothetical protein
VRTTIRIDDDLYRRAKARAAQEGRPVGELITDAVRAALTRPAPAEDAVPPLPTYGGNGTLPGVDLADAAALGEVMDADEDVDALR